MDKPHRYDAVVVGSGPNGLAAAITMARAGRSVLVIEGKDEPGGGTRTAELTLPGFLHDSCSAIHPLGVSSPFFRTLGLETYGLEWVFSPAEVAHPLDDGTAVLFTRSLTDTARSMGQDEGAYRRLIGPHLRSGPQLIDQLLGPLRFPRRPLALAWFGLQALLPASTLARLAFRGSRARAAFAGMSAHSMMPFSWGGTGGFGLMLSLLAHTNGYPLVRGGSQRLSQAMLALLQHLGGEVVTGRMIERIEELPAAGQVFFDVTPRQLLQIAGDCFTAGYQRGLRRYRYGVGVFKVDYALDAPIPWKARECLQAATVHLGGTLEDIEESEAAAMRGVHHPRPFVLLAQQSLFDASRAPAGKHTVWAYCHAPNGSDESMLEAVEGQIERFAPGFRSRILARHTINAVQMEQYNPNYVGGDINGGVQNLAQFFTRPVPRLVPYSTTAPNIFLCSSSTPPGGGVHGMCGYFAAKAALKD